MPSAQTYRLRTLGPTDLRGGSGAQVLSVLARPKVLAVLVYLALARPAGFQRRDALLALLWPELDAEHARAALRKAIHQLRQSLGADTILSRADDALGLAEGRVWVDAVEFEEHVQAGRISDALREYRGDLLPGLYVSGAPEFEHWLDGERDRLRRLAIRARAQSESLSAGAPGMAAQPVQAPTRSADVGGRRTLWIAAIAAVAMVTLVTTTYLLAGPHREQDRPVVMVGEITDFAAADSVVRVVPSLLLTNLGREQALRTVSSTIFFSRLSRQSGGSTISADAARRAGAQEIVDGALYRRPDGLLRLDLRRTRLVDGALLSSHSVSGGDAFTLVDRATAELLGAIGGAARQLRVADVTTRSAAAYAMYERGMRAYYQHGNARDAHALLQHALEEDPEFASAAYYAAVTSPDSARGRWLERAYTLSVQGTDRDRLLARWAWLHWNGDLRSRLIADSLTSLVPDDPEAHVAAGATFAHLGDFARSIGHLRTARRLVSSIEPGPRCVTCDVSGHLIRTYLLADSMAAALMVAGEWVARTPASVGAWAQLGTVQESAGALADAKRSWQRVLELDPGNPEGAFAPARISIRGGDFRAADRRLDGISESLTEPDQGQALWFRIISLRHQGRLNEALTAARHLDRMGRRSSGRPPAAEALPLATVLSELGRHREAAALLDSLADVVHDGAPDSALTAHAARDRAWRLTLAASAHAAAGDTAQLPRLVERVEALGSRSAYGRDQLAHFYIRGLLLRARGRHSHAEGAFRRSIYSPTFGYTRGNIELAKLLMAQGRGAEAAAVLAPALRGSLHAANMYATHTEVHELLARAWDQAAVPDSALYHYRWVANALAGADPSLAPRYAFARDRVRALAAPAAARD